MKTIADLQDDLSIMFGGMIEGMTSTEMDTMLAFIMTSFAGDFPKIKTIAYRFDNLDTTTSSYSLRLPDIDDELLEIKMIIPIKPKMGELYNTILASNETSIELEEKYAIQMTAQYIDSMSMYYVPQKPMIVSDSTGDFLNIVKDVMLLTSCLRVLNPSLIQEHIYAVLKPYASYKFIDFIINRNFGDMLEMNGKIFDLMYDAISGDMTSGEGLEGIQSVSLGGLSVSFNNKLQNYANTLNGLSSSMTNPTMIDQLNKYRKEYLRQFKRKKNLFYNFMF